MSVPLLNPGWGVYVTTSSDVSAGVPLSKITAVPFVGATVILLIDKISPSKSESFVNTGIFTEIFGSVDDVSSSATGLSFTGVTVIFNVLFAVFTPSVAV